MTEIKIDAIGSFTVKLARKAGHHDVVYGIVRNPEDLNPDVEPVEVVIPEPVIYGDE